MSRRPDYADYPGGEEARMGQHRRCVCGDCQPCTCTPSPGWHPPDWWPANHADLRLVHAAIEASDRALSRKLDRVLEEIHAMGAQTDAGIAHLKDDLSKVRDGWASLIAERDQWKAAAENADANAAAQVAAALEADDSHDAASIAEADALVHDLVNQAEQPPADSGDGSAPADGGGEPVPADGSGDEPAPVVEPAPDQPADSGDGSAPADGSAPTE